MNYSLGIYEKALPSDLTWDEKLIISKKAGYDFLEISIDESDQKLSRLDWSIDERLELLETMNKVGLPIRSLCLSGHRKYPLGSLDENIRKKSLEICKKAIDFADFFGIRIIQIAGYDVYYENSCEESKKYFSENLRKFVDMAAAKGILLGFETMETEFMDTCAKTLKYVDQINSPYLSIYPDCGNLNNAAIKYGHSVLDDLEKAKGKISAMHLKETEPGKYRDMLFGQGRVDFDSIVQKARELGVNRFVTEFWFLGGDYFDEIKHQVTFARKLLDKYYRG